MLSCTWNIGSIARNTIARLYETLTYAPNILSKWISKPRQQRNTKQVMVVENSLKIFMQAKI